MTEKKITLDPKNNKFRTATYFFVFPTSSETNTPMKNLSKACQNFCVTSTNGEENVNYF